MPNLICRLVGHNYAYLSRAGQHGHKVWCRRCLRQIIVKWAPTEPKNPEPTPAPPLAAAMESGNAEDALPSGEWTR